MTQVIQYSADQKRAYDHLINFIRGGQGICGVAGKAGSGKTQLLSDLYQHAKSEGYRIIEPDFERKSKAQEPTLAILTPTNKASAVLRRRGVPATTLHRIIYRPIYHPEYEAIAEWLTNGGNAPQSEFVNPDALERAKLFYDQTPSVPAALAIIGARGSDFIQGWKKRDESLDIGLIDESSMIDSKQFEDLKEIFDRMILFGDPAQLAPIGESTGMVFDKIETNQKYNLSRIHRQSNDNPILDLAHMLSDPNLDFTEFESHLKQISQRDDRISVSPKVNTDQMAKAPVLVWRNATRKRLIQGFRRAYDIQDGQLRTGEPLICDGLELPLKHRAKRVDLEARGLIKGAAITFLGEGKRAGFARIHVIGSSEPHISVASIIQIESPDQEEPELISAARMGAVFVHGAASTIHKAQGSQWPEVQIFAPDIAAAARTGREEAGVSLWKRLLYVALTRAEERIFWITDYRMQKPSQPLSADMNRETFELKLTPE